MKITATAELGALGNKESQATEFEWKQVSPLPKLIPWALLLVLFCLKINRPAHARFLLIPSGLSFVLVWLYGLTMSMASTQLDFVGQIGMGILMGITYLWLLSPLVCSPWRFFTWLRSFVIMAGGACLAYGASSSFQFVRNETTAVLIAVAIFSAISTVSLSMTGYFCRKPHGPLRYPLYLIASVLLTTLLSLTVVMVATETPPMWQFIIVVGVASLMAMLFLLPFLILSASCAFYRERFRALVGMPTAEELQRLAAPLTPQENPAVTVVTADTNVPDIR